MQAHWERFYKFYTSTVDSKWGIAYLEPSFFSTMHRLMPDKVPFTYTYIHTHTHTHTHTTHTIKLNGVQ